MLRLEWFILNRNTGSTEGDFICGSFLKVSYEVITKPKHFFKTRPKVHVFCLKSPPFVMILILMQAALQTSLFVLLGNTFLACYLQKSSLALLPFGFWFRLIPL